MTANNQPIYSRAPDIQFCPSSYLTTGASSAANAADLTSGTGVVLLFTAGANGSFVTKVRLRSTPAGNTTACVFRLWINNGSTTGTASNSILFDEITLPVTTASSTAATPSYEIPLNFALPAGYKLYGVLSTTSTNGWAATVIGGDY